MAKAAEEIANVIANHQTHLREPRAITEDQPFSFAPGLQGSWLTTALRPTQWEWVHLRTVRARERECNGILGGLKRVMETFGNSLHRVVMQVNSQSDGKPIRYRPSTEIASLGGQFQRTTLQSQLSPMLCAIDSARIGSDRRKRDDISIVVGSYPLELRYSQ